MRTHHAIFVAACVCLQWTRLTGVVKGINLKDSTLTIQNRDGDLLIVPIDYQVNIIEKHEEMRDLKHLVLDEKVTLVCTPADKPKEDTEGLAPPEPAHR